MNLPAELVILSVFNTAGGNLNELGDLHSIGYSFQLAGTKAVIMSQWAVDDKSTLLIMTKFYENKKRTRQKKVTKSS